MIEINKLLAELVQQGVSVYLENDKLKAKAYKGKMTVEHRALIAEHKVEIIAFLQKKVSLDKNVSSISTVHEDKSKSLSFAQKRLWFVDQMQNGSSEYNMPMAFSVYHEFDEARAKLALNTIIQRHEILRTIYKQTPEGPVQHVLSDINYSIESLDFSHLSTTEQQNALSKQAYEHAAKVFALDKDILLSACYIHLDPAPVDEQSYGILLFNMHHIASDAWSLEILQREFISLYSDPLLTLAPLKIQYSDYGHWQQDWANSSGYQAQMDYWRQQLAGLPEKHELPLDYTRPKTKKFIGAKSNQKLSTKVMQSLLILAKRYQLSPFMCLHAAFSLLLSKFSGSEDIVIGTTVANRTRSEIAPLIGCFLNRLVLRTDTSAQTIDTYLNYINKLHLDAQSNQDIPFEHLVDLSGIGRSNSYTPLFQIQLTCNDNSNVKATSVEGTMQKSLFEPYVPAKLDIILRGDLDLHAEFLPDGLVIGWSYDDALFSEISIDNMMSHFARILTNLAKLAEQPEKSQQQVNELHQLDTSEITLLTSDHNQNDKQFTDNKGLIEHFEQQVVKNPHAIAVTDNDQALSYAMLNTQANKLADCLLEQGLEPGELVGVCMQRGAALMVALLGVLKTGAAYIPFEPGNSKGRNQQIIEDAGLEWVVVSEELTPQIPDAGVDMLVLETNVTESNWLAGYSSDNLNVIPDDTAPAYVIYTSGSTGKPKGVEISHTSLMDYLNYGLAEYYAAHLDGALLITSHGFDIGVPSLYLPLLQGDCVNLLDNEELLPNLAKQMESARENYLIRMTPNHVEGMLTLLTTDENNGRHVFVIGGERFDRELAIALQQQFPNSQIFNHYGPSEATVGCVIYDVTANRSQLPAELPIGKPMHNTHAYVLDEALNVLPLGAKGELLIGGPCLATGYINNPILTASQFIDNPYFDATDKRSPKRLYRTGDQVRYQADGNLMFLGRVDDQIKIRGFRIELGDIASQLNQLPEVESAQVVAKDFGTGTQLVAYIKGTTADSDDAEFVNLCRQQLVQNLPKYMVPDSFVVITSWPLTPNGKLDKKSLPAPTGTAQGDIYIAPANSTEQALVEIWSKLLKQPQENISTDVSFFSLGGHSLLSVRLVAELRSVFGVELSIRELFDNNCISAQASLLINKQGNGTQIYTAIPAVARPENGHIPASYAQQRIWFIDRLQGGSAEYNMPVAFNVDGKLDLKVMERALNTIISRHEVLRTVYCDADHGTEQVIRKSAEFKLEQLNVSDLDTVGQQQAIATHMGKIFETPFDLKCDLMVRAAYISTASDAGILLFNMHHIASDGWSMQLLIKEFVQLYQAYDQGMSNPLAPLEIQYSDYAYWQRDHLKGGVLEQQLGYWQQQLSDMPAIHSLPLDFNRSEVKQYQGENVNGHLSAEVAEKLILLAKNQGLTPFMLLHSALALLLSRHSNSQDIVIGTPVANRLQAELEPIIGFFVNTLVLRVNTRQKSLNEYFNHVKNVHLDAQSNQDVPFEQLVEHLNVPRSTAHTPLFQIMLTTQTDYGINDPGLMEDLKLGEATLTGLGSDNLVAKFDLDINIALNDEGVNISWIFDSSLFTQEHISRLNEHLCRLLEGMSQLPQEQQTTELSALPILAKSEQHKLLFELNQTQANYDTQLCMHQWIEQQVAQTPDAIALSFEGRHLSYHALNQKANQLAHYLLEQHHIGPDKLVGLCLERSFEMVIGLFAILKAGGAYVPLDPDLPQERLTYMSENAHINLVLSHSACVNKLNQLSVDKSCDTVLLDEFLWQTDIFSQYSDLNIPVHEIGLKSGDLAYMLYTSGSTGKPKGVMVSHKALVNRIDWMDKQYLAEPEDSILQKTPFSFDVSVWEFMWPLCKGAKMVIAKPQGHKDPAYLCKLIQDNQINKLHFVPSMLGVMLEYGGLSRCTSLKQVFCSGEALQVDHVEAFIANLPQSELHNLYGPTEAAIDVSHWNCLQDLGSSVPIGKPIQNIQLLILDEQQQLVPFGCTGELYIGGDGLARGYYGREDLTKERFIANPYFDKGQVNSSERLYRTGDLVRYLKNGDIEYLGRTDHQVKINGLRIELGEIEEQIKSSGLVSSALVMATNEVPVRLVAYVQKVSTHVVDQLKSQLEKVLPKYMQPSQFIMVDDWPITANGKLDRKRLPKASVLDESGKPLETANEHMLAALWHQVTGVSHQKVNQQSDFFAVGGSSLKLIKLALLIEQSFGTEVNIQALLRTSRLSQQIALIEHKEGEDQKPAAIELQSGTELTLICFPGAADVARRYQELAQFLPDNINIVVYEHLSLAATPDSLSEYAALFKGEIQRKFAQQLANQNVVLLGHSFGGALALSVAKKMDNEASLPVVLLDSYLQSNNLCTEQIEDAFSAISRHIGAGVAPSRQLKQMKQLLYKHVSLLEAYKPEVNRPCLLLAAADNLNWTQDYDNYLTEELNIKVTKCKGDHYSILSEPNVQKLAKHITEFINEHIRNKQFKQERINHDSVREV